MTAWSGQEVFDRILDAVDLTGDPGEIRERTQAQWREAHRKKSRISKLSCAAAALAAS